MLRLATYVKPRCDDTNLRSARPISGSFSDETDLRHSTSRSYVGIGHQHWNCISPQSVRSSKGTRLEPYIDTKVVINSDSLAKCEQVLHEICKFPHISKLV